LAHDVFLRLLRKPRTFDSHREARAYLAAMARGICIDWRRRRQIEDAWLEAEAEYPGSADVSPEHRALLLETLYEIDAMLRRLPTNVARAFTLSQLHGLTYRTIADRLGVSERMIKKYMARAMYECALIEAGMAPHQ
jgi:RNA polymerase sigma-70 factor (ECF subfamily)